MQGVPHWRLFLLIYMIMVAVPVMIVHYRLRKQLRQDKSWQRLVMYFLAVVGTAFIMHLLTMLLYFKFLFTVKA